MKTLRQVLLISLGSFLLGLVVFHQAIFDSLLKKAAVRKFTRQDATWLHDGKVHVILVGTGTPAVEENTAQSCVAIIAQDEVLLFDTGANSTRKAEWLGIPLAHLTHIFLTHFHSDHISDLGAMINATWRAGRADTLFVHGPVGTQAVVDGFTAAFKADAEYRYHDMPLFAPIPLAFGQAKEFAVSDTAATLAYRSPKGTKVYAFAVDHRPAEPAVGYRIEIRGRIITLSGDTKASTNVRRYATQADVLIHEAFNKELLTKLLQAANTIPPAERDVISIKTAQNTAHNHTTPIEAALIAQQAGAKRLVLTHIIPPVGEGITGVVMRRLFTRGVAEKYTGEVTLAKDGTHITL